MWLQTLLVFGFVWLLIHVKVFNSNTIQGIATTQMKFQIQYLSGDVRGGGGSFDISKACWPNN